MKPWGASGGPGEARIRELVADHTVAEIARMYNVNWSSAKLWVEKAGCASPPAARLNHHEFLPWRVPKRHGWSSIAGALRAWSTMAQGHEMSVNQTYQYNKLRDHLEQPRHYAPHGMVVDYNPEDGFFLVPRDPAVDDPNLPIRRPA